MVTERQRDPVVRLLPVTEHLIPSRLQLGARECIVFDLGFLHAQDIRSMLAEPRDNAVQPFANGVDVPSGYLHPDLGRGTP
jgi:hypothetical protein